MLVSASTADAQIGRMVAKEEAKAAAKQGAKAGAKTAAKKVAKEMAEKAVEKAAKNAAKKAANEMTGEIIEHSAVRAGRYALKSTYKNVGGASMRSVEKMVGEKEYKAVLKEVSDNSLEKASKAFVRKGSKELASSLGTKVTKEVAKGGITVLTKTEIKLAEKKTIVKTCEKSVIKSLVSECEEKAIKNAEKRAIKGVIKGAREEVEHVLGKRAGDIWSQCFKQGSEEKTKLLLKDIAGNADLHRALTKNPDLLKSYYQLADSPYRTDISMLRYVNYGAGKYSRSVSHLASSVGYGDDLVIKTASGVHSMYDGAGNFLGTITGDARTGYVITASSESRKLLSLYPMNNATYKCDGITWITDHQGRVSKVHYTNKGKVAKVERDGRITRDAVRCKNDFTVNGNATHTAELYPTDEGGHLIALQNGGTNDLINIVGQSPRANHGVGAKSEMDNIWKRAENSASRAMNKGKEVTTEIELNYGDKFTMRPKSFTLTQKVDGVIDEVPIKKNKVAIDHITITND